jgi:signal transduction histidine kinase
MRLMPFIVENSEAILQEFEEFARTHTTAGDTMDIVALRDHAAGMLVTIADDMGRAQSDAAQELKSKGDAPDPAGDREPTAAERHGTDRAVSGFTLEEMFAEYRALRGSVLRLWTESGSRALDEQDVNDLIRFNEAIDQALAESVTRFSTGLERSREMFLAILGHDLRSPLGAVITASSFLVTDGDLEGDNLTLASRIRSSAERMKKLIADLLDFTSARMGRGIPITPGDADLAEIARETVSEIQDRYPDRAFQVEATGDVRGQWDPSRLSQVLANLVGNAVQHGQEDSPISITVRGQDDQVLLAVHNQGPPIPPDNQREIFSPFKRMASTAEAADETGSMGLGLYIAQQIAVAHGGWIRVRSAPEEGTTFEVSLPRR